MKQTKHKILSVFLSFCMIISCMVGMSVTAYANGKNVKITSVEGDEEPFGAFYSKIIEREDNLWTLHYTDAVDVMAVFINWVKEQ